MVRTSVSLPDDLAAELARLGPSATRRSEIVVNALRAYFELRSQPRSDTEILNGHAEELNAEAEDVLEFQRLL
jgi:metal-responsive CopG/Arc/MetJ family transcriptional regulator